MTGKLASASAKKPSDELAGAIKFAFPGTSKDYASAREALLAEEIEFRRHATRLAAQRAALPPGPIIKKDYRFKDEQGFDATLANLFGDHEVLVTIFGCMVQSDNGPVRCARTGSAR